MSLRVPAFAILTALFGAALRPVEAAPPETVERIVARVDDKILTESELERVLRPVLQQYGQTYSGAELQEKEKAIRANAINNWMERELILKEARAIEHFKVDTLEVEQRFQEEKKRFATSEDFDLALAREGLDEKKMKQMLEDQLKVRVLTYQNVTSKVSISPQEIMEFYEKHPEEFATPEMVRVSQILIPTPARESERPAALAMVQDILKKLDAGQDFAALAREYSRGPHAEQGGDLGYFEKGQMRDEVFELDVGQHTGLIESESGFLVIEVTGKKEAYRKPLAEVWEDLEDKMFQEKFQGLYDAWIEKLKAKAYIEPRPTPDSGALVPVIES